MKTYPLASFEYRGASHGGCSLDIDEGAARLEVWRPSGLLRRGKAVLAQSAYGAETDVQVVGPTVRVDGMVLTPAVPDKAAEISELVGRPRVLKQQAANDLVAAESAALAFVKAREDDMSFLAQLKEDPKGAVLSRSQEWTDKGRDPVEEVMEKRSKQLADAFGEFNSATAKVEAQSGKGAVDKLYAFVYCLGLIQDGLLAGGTDLSAEIGFLGEMGLKDINAADLELGSSSEKMFALFRRST